MGDFNYINPPGAGSLGPSGIPTGSDIEENWFFPVSGAPVSLEVINGHLTSPNLAALQRFKRFHVQRGTLSEGRPVGSTSNVDYFWSLFGDLDKVYSGSPRQWVPNADMVQYFEPIPGANIEFYNPYDNAKVLLNWNIIWFNDGYAETSQNVQNNITKVQMFYSTSPNDTKQTLDNVGDRKCPPCFLSPPGGTSYWPWAGQAVLLNSMASRSWSGHKLVTLTGKGWYSAGLRLLFPGQAEQVGSGGEISAPSASIYQSRVRTRSMRYILFKS